MNISFNNKEYGVLSAALTNRRERILEVKQILIKKGDQEMVEIYEKELETVKDLEQRLYREFLNV